MNKDNARDYLPLVQALAEGKTIEYEYVSEKWREVQNIDTIGLSLKSYRIKPEPSQDNIEIAMALEDMAKKIREMKVHCFDFETKAVQAGNGLVCESRFTWQNMNQQVATGGAYANDPKISGWIEWNGGNCPVKSSETVEVKFRLQTIKTDIDLAGVYRWHHAKKSGLIDGDPQCDIIAYRIVK